MTPIKTLLNTFIFVGTTALGSGFALAQAPLTLSTPAEVPAVVAIARPSAAETDAARNSFAKFVAKADPKTQIILKKYPGLLEVRPPGPNSAVLPSLAPGFVAKHQANLAVAKQGDAELLFMGDSITDFWRNSEGNYAGKAVMDKHFGQWKIANYGIAGDTTQGVLYRLEDGEGSGISPRAIMLMIGTNNTARNSAAEIAEGVGAVVLSLQRHYPTAQILLLGIFPRGGANDPLRGMLAEINKSISKLDDGKQVHYLDIGAGFLEADGNISREVMSDGLHPTAKGYEIWAQAVEQPLAKLMGAGAK
ncbi:MAG: GDSL-type esterase/lipase family protein [Pseudomonadota bacterium]